MTKRHVFKVWCKPVRANLALTAGLLLMLAQPAQAAQPDQNAPDALKPSTADGTAKPAKKTAKAPAANTGAKSEKKMSGSEETIAVLVNDEPITNYEINQRAQMLAGGSIGEYMKANFQARWTAYVKGQAVQQEFRSFAQARNPKSKEEVQALQKEFILGKQKSMAAQMQAEARSHIAPKTRTQAIDELIDERLKLQEAKRLNAVVGEDDVDKVIDNIAERNKLKKEQLAQQLGGSLDAMKSRIRATLSFNEVIRRKFGHQIMVTGKDVDKFVASAAAGGEDQVELQVQRIAIAVPPKIDQAALAQRLREADALRTKFKDCATVATLAQGVQGARHENLGKRRPSTIPEPTRTLLLNAKDGEMLPAVVGDNDVELWAVCGRDVVKAADEQRTQAEGELKQKEFEMLTSRHLKDLRTDAHIERR